MKIAVGVHSESTIDAEVYFNHISAIGYWAQKNDITFIGVSRVKVAAARKKITEIAIEASCDYILFLDTDHLISANMLELLLENKDAAMVSALVYRRLFPFTPIVFKLDKQGLLQDALINPNTGVYNVDGCAMGCTLINLALLQQLKKPYWEDKHFRSDLNLCTKFKEELNARICVDTRIMVDHLGDRQRVNADSANQLRLDSMKGDLDADSI